MQISTDSFSTVVNIQITHYNLNVTTLFLLLFSLMSRLFQTSGSDQRRFHRSRTVRRFGQIVHREVHVVHRSDLQPLCLRVAIFPELQCLLSFLHVIWKNVMKLVRWLNRKGVEVRDRTQKYHQISSLLVMQRMISSHFNVFSPSEEIIVYSSGEFSSLVMHLFKLTLLLFMSDGLDFFGLRSIFLLIIFFWTWCANNAVEPGVEWKL